jgi:hypothetical protein
MTTTLERLQQAFGFDEQKADHEWDRKQHAYSTQSKSFLFKWGCRFQNKELTEKLLPLIAEMAEALEWYKINSTDQQCCNEPVTMAHLALAKLDALIKKEER